MKTDAKRHPKVLIVGTIPYNKNTSSRAFDAYFHRWEKENIRQIFSNTKTPVKGHCGSLYQITDARLVKRWFHKTNEVGVIFEDKELPDDWRDSDLEVGSKAFSFMYKVGSKESSFKHMARKILWREKYWNTKQLNQWLDEFKPECVFLAFSDDFFIPEIALYVAEKYDVPIMSCIGDDYIFNERKSLSLIYHVYRKLYKKLIYRVFKHGGSAIYIGDKIRDKYNAEFGLHGDTIYLTSNIKRHNFRVINKSKPKITYCGNIRLGRNYSLADIGYALGRIHSDYMLDVYSVETNEEYIKPLKECPNVQFHGAVPYAEVETIMAASDILVVVEGFDDKDVTVTKYSLSTKAADSLATGGQILAYGSIDCGVIEYLSQTGGAVVCNEKAKLEKQIKQLIWDEKLQKELYTRAGSAFAYNHNAERNLDRSEQLFREMINEYGKRQNGIAHKYL